MVYIIGVRTGFDHADASWEGTTLAVNEEGRALHARHTPEPPKRWDYVYRNTGGILNNQKEQTDNFWREREPSILLQINVIIVGTRLANHYHPMPHKRIHAGEKLCISRDCIGNHSALWQTCVEISTIHTKDKPPIPMLTLCKIIHYLFT